jgi:hypothetical protein
MGSNEGIAVGSNEGIAVTTPQGESNKMNELLTETVQGTVCKFDLHSECASGEADAATCAKCTADSAAEIVRVQL